MLTEYPQWVEKRTLRLPRRWHLERLEVVLNERPDVAVSGRSAFKQLM